MKYLKLIIISLFAGLCMNSCDFLDVQDYYEDTLSYDSVFHSTRNVTKYLWSIPADFPDEGAILSDGYTPGPLATDEGIVSFTSEEFRGMSLVLGKVKPEDLKGLDNWSSMYKIIRRVNILFSRIDEAVDMKPTDKFEILSYARFIRAYAYYHLLMNFGPVILVGDEVMENNETPEYYDTHRATYDESVEYICSELEEAAKYMPPKALTTQFGRPTKGAAYGLIARLRLQHASPAYNGGDAAKRYFGSWTRSTDGVHYVSQTYDETRWAIAAAAAERVMNMGYGLYTVLEDSETPALPDNVPSALFPEGAGGIDHFRSYSEMFNGEAVSVQNQEFVWARMSDRIRENTKHSFSYTICGGWNGMCVTQKVVDAFYMIDGRDKSNSSKEYPYSEEGMYSGGAKKFSGYTLNNNIYNMYVNREMRFYATIGFSKRFWANNSTTETDRKNKTIEYHLGGNADRYDRGSDTPDYNLTGYVITKYVHPDDAWAGDGSMRLDKPYPIIRYAEILISYAEALNNLTKTHTVTLPDGIEGEATYTVSRDLDKIRGAFNQIRYRAGLPGLEETTRDDIQSAIERERMIEFLYENRRYFDVRRWGIYEESESEPIVGMNIMLPEPGFYSRTPVNHKFVRDRIINKRMVFLPIPKDEILKVKSLDQNPGW
ncbi:RagB/SusD family nutrient uptake outer membrane protein [Prevotella sp. 10(H)]|uniref:RagB/SusD family nutrient uptake outer membrane protein n=1 Tax=Prevotella sp. 10(H) TaxID=1158294 RepID=UPI0004A75DFE|nr:RagB/SusD family nutrient uptake outer membrane protein [Prevotella sp. 10(H)]